MKNLISPKKEMFDNIDFKNMDDYYSLVQKFKDDYEGTWGEFAKEKLKWIEPFTNVLNCDNAPFYRWFENGKLNIAEQCIDRHQENDKNKAAIIFQGDRGDKEVVTYRELLIRVNKTANMLKEDFNIKKGDRVVLYMPMIVESVVMMLACNRVGAVHSIVFGGFSAKALRDRIVDAKASLVVTADGAYRKGKPYMLKPVVDEALKEDCQCVKKVCVVVRNNEDIEWVNGRDYEYSQLIESKSHICPSEVMDSEDIMFLLYTSGSTGSPKGIEHHCGGYILWAMMTMQWVFDLKKSDTFWCSADIGWITGHTYSVYGPLSGGATTVIFEGVPTYPDASICWSIIEEYQVNQFYTAPTAIRMLHKIGADEPSKYDLSSLRVIGTVGEPIDENSWDWYFNTVGKGNCSLVDTYWQTETGGHIVSAIASITPIKPSCATLPLPGIIAEVLDENGNVVKTHEKGLMCVSKPWPSMLRNVYNDSDRFIKTYFSDIKKDNNMVYFTGDGAVVDENGYITITGRVDDVINVSGHRIGTAEIESAIKHHKNVAMVAVVSKPHEIKGESIFAFVALKDDDGIGDEVEAIKEINNILKEQIGAIAICDTIIFVEDLPKTRSGKIMRRLLRAIVKGENITQDISTLENPSIINDISALMSSK